MPAGLCANPGKYPELSSDLHRWVMCVDTHTLNRHTHTDIHTYTETHTQMQTQQTTKQLSSLNDDAPGLQTCTCVMHICIHMCICVHKHDYFWHWGSNTEPLQSQTNAALLTHPQPRLTSGQPFNPGQKLMWPSQYVRGLTSTKAFQIKN